MELSNKRCIRILHLLLKSRDTVTGENLGVSIGVSSRTIRNDIKELNQILKDYGACVVSEISQGYHLRIEDQEKFSGFLKGLERQKKGRDFQNIIPSEPEDRVRYIISKLLLASLNGSQEIIDFFDLEEELFISTSTLKKDFRTIDHILNDYGLRVSITKKKGVHIVGDEQKIRYCISEYIFNSGGYFGAEENEFYASVFTQKEMEDLRKILLDAMSRHDLRLTDIAFKNVLVHSLIMLKRFAGQQSVTYKKSDIEEFESKKEFGCAKDIVEQIEEMFGMDLGNEVYYLTQHLLSSQRFLIDDPEDDYKYKPEIEKILKTIRDETNIDLSDDKQLINGLAMHLEAALQRLRFDMNIRNEFLDSIKNMYPLAFELAVLASQVIEDTYNFKTKENEIGFLAMHFGAALERKGLNRKPKKPKKAVIVCIAGVATAMLLKEKIQKHFGQKIKIERTCPQQEVTQELIDSVDLVLTTVELTGFSTTKIKKINLFLEEEDMRAIQNAIEEKPNGEIVDYRAIFPKDLFFPEGSFRDKTEAMEYMTEIMKKKDYITESVKQSIFKREEMATTELGSLVAIPHALLNNTQEAVVSVMILNKPILWENEKVQVVLLLNIPKDKYAIWEVVFKRLYQYLIGEQGVTRLIRNRNYEEFIGYLEQG